MSDLYIDVTFPLPLEPFTYKVRFNDKHLVKPGNRVLARLGRRRITGFILGVVPAEKLRHQTVRYVEDILDFEPYFSQALLDLAGWIAEYYICSEGEALKAMMPPGMDVIGQQVVRSKKKSKDFNLTAWKKKSILESKILKVLYLRRSVTVRELKRKISSPKLDEALRQLEADGQIDIHQQVSAPRARTKLDQWVRLNPLFSEDPDRLELMIDSMISRAPKQAEILRMLMASRPAPDTGLRRGDLLFAARAGTGSLKSLAKLDLVEFFEKEVVRNPYDIPFQPAQPLTLTPEQSSCVEKINQAVADQHYSTFLLHGVTGSGKTQVYIEAIKEALQRGRTALVLVPEISLTPQMVARFKSHFDKTVAVFHSSMSLGERFDSWRKTRSGDFKIVIGTRSAVFAPLQNLGLIIVDEEHEHTYKQSETDPRYNGRDVAIVRASLEKAVVVLGSATPSVESYHNALSGKYDLLRLTHRIDHVRMPVVTLVDMKTQKDRHTPGWDGVFSEPLRQKISEKLKRNEQVILFQNRRGFASYVSCDECGYVAECRNCSITLTYHRAVQKLQCHYCGFRENRPEFCPQCGNLDLNLLGTGTQKVEDRLAVLFPGARVVRMDMDTTSKKGAHDRILRAFGAGAHDILLGTQMVAKGLDFERVSLVGVISGDTGLLLPDFRASERTFQLLTQVAGRAGRKSHDGEVIIQTLNPDKPALRFAQQHDFIGFYKHEIENRRELGYAPFSRVTVVLFKAADEQAVRDSANAFDRLLRKQARSGKLAKIQILGPAAAVLQRIKRLYRWHMLIKTPRDFDRSGRLTKGLIQQTLAEYKRNASNRVRISIDVDPYDML